MCVLLKTGRRDAFAEIYDRYWERLYRYIYNRLGSHDDAFEITQEVFLSLLERETKIEFHTSLPGFLFASVRYQIINHIDKQKVRRRYRDEYTNFRAGIIHNPIEEAVNLHDLEGAVSRGLEELPQRCQEIFRMNRLQHRSVKEIAEQLNISHRTVENQLSAALRHLRVSLGEFMVVLFLLFG